MSNNSFLPCICSKPTGNCPRYKRPMLGRSYEVCSEKYHDDRYVLAPHTREAFLTALLEDSYRKIIIDKFVKTDKQVVEIDNRKVDLIHEMRAATMDKIIYTGSGTVAPYMKQDKVVFGDTQGCECITPETTALPGPTGMEMVCSGEFINPSGSIPCSSGSGSTFPVPSTPIIQEMIECQELLANASNGCFGAPIGFPPIVPPTLYYTAVPPASSACNCDTLPGGGPDNTPWEGTFFSEATHFDYFQVLYGFTSDRTRLSLDVGWMWSVPVNCNNIGFILICAENDLGCLGMDLIIVQGGTQAGSVNCLLAAGQTNVNCMNTIPLYWEFNLTTFPDATGCSLCSGPYSVQVTS